MIDYPKIAIENEERLAAEMIGRVSGGVSEDALNMQIATRRELLLLVAEGLDTPICEELTNANPSSPHTVILEAIAWALSQQSYRFNRVPEANLIAFANLFGINRRPAIAADTVLEFTVDPPPATDVTIPAGTEVATYDSKFIFTTDADLTIEYGDETGTVTATRDVTGRTLLSANVITKLIDQPAFVTDVTNPNAVDAGSEIEPIAETLERVRRYMRRGERIVSTKDLEDAIRDEALQGNGVVRAFPFVKNGNFGPNSARYPGFTSVIVMTRTGEIIDAPSRQRIAALTDTAVGNQFIAVVDPQFVNFNISCDIKVNTGSPEGGVVAAVEANLRAFYAASKENFGRPILRSEIIAVIEGTTGVDRIELPQDIDRESMQILRSPTSDTTMAEYQIPRLATVTINVV